MKESLAITKNVNFSIDHDDVWWVEVPSQGLTVMFSVDMKNQGILFDENDNGIVLSGTSTFAVFVNSTFVKARKLQKMIGGSLEVQPKF